MPEKDVCVYFPILSGTSCYSLSSNFSKLKCNWRYYMHSIVINLVVRFLDKPIKLRIIRNFTLHCGSIFFSFWWSLEDWCHTFITLPGPGEFSLFFPSIAYWCINCFCHNAWCSTPSYSNQSIHYVKLYFRSSLYCYEDFCDVWKQKILLKNWVRGEKKFPLCCWNLSA